MAQGNNKKALNKMMRKGNKGFPIATVAFYGVDNKTATKLVCGIIPYDGSYPEPINKWFKATDIRKDELILKEVLSFIEDNGAQTVSIVEGIIGCPHEEGIDYPEGEHCPQCLYWKNRDSFTGSSN